MVGEYGKASKENQMNTNIREVTKETHEIITNAYQQELDGNITAEQRREVVANALKEFGDQVFVARTAGER